MDKITLVIPFPPLLFLYQTTNVIFVFSPFISKHNMITVLPRTHPLHFPSPSYVPLFPSYLFSLLPNIALRNEKNQIDDTLNQVTEHSDSGANIYIISEKNLD